MPPVPTAAPTSNATPTDAFSSVTHYSEQTHAVARLLVLSLISITLCALFVFLPYSPEIEPVFVPLMQLTAGSMVAGFVLYLLGRRVLPVTVATAGIFTDYAYLGAAMFIAPVLMSPALALFPLIAHTIGVRYGSRLLAICMLLGFTVLFVVSTAPWYSDHWPLLLLAFLLTIAIPAIVHLQFLALQRAREEAVRASRAKTTFLATMSHELRTPLTAIVSATDLLLLEETHTQYATHIRSNAVSLLDTVSDVLDLSSIEHGTLPIDPVAFNFDDMVAQVLNGLAPRARQKGLSLDLHIPQPIGWVFADPRRFRQIFNNLVGNAIKFTEHGAITLAVTRRDGQLQIRVEDTGPGIPESHHRAIFSPFVQISSGPARLHGGTGLGLAIVQALVERMHGVIEVDSAPGQGATFIVTVPVLAAPPAGIANRAQDVVALIESHKSRHSPKRILLVDDAPNNRAFLGALLRRAGHHVSESDSADSAEAILQSEAFDLLFLDIHMPQRSGFELVADLRRRRVATPPLVFLTGDVTHDARIHAARLDAQGLLTKPVDVHALLESVEIYAKS